MRPRPAVAAAFAVLAMVLPAAFAPAGADGGGGREPMALEPMAFGVPYAYRQMEGLQTNLFSPAVTYDHLHDVAFAPDGHMAIGVGSHNTLVGWDAANQTARILRNGTLGNLYGVAWSDDSQSALAVGYGGALILYDGASITDLAPHGSTLWQGAAYVPGSGFLVVGNGGAMFFLNGATRTNVTSPTVSDLLAVAYSSVLGRALAVGRGGVVIEVSPAGSTTVIASPVTDDLRAVGFESDTGKGLVAGGNGTLLSYMTGTLANETHAAIDGQFYDLTVTHSGEPAVIAVRNATTGSLLFHNLTFSNTLVIGTGLAGVGAVAMSPTAGYAVATGFYGMFVQAWQNGTFTNVSPPFRPVFTDAAWRPTGDLALLVGFNGTVVLYNRTSNATTPVAGPNATASLRGVSWAPNGSEAILVGAYALWRYSASTGLLSEPSPGPPDLYGIAFRPGGTEALVVGTSGFIGTWNGTNLTRVSSTGMLNGFFAVKWHADGLGNGDHAYIVGANMVARFDPPNIISTTGRTGTFFDVAFLGNDVWTVGSQHKIERYDDANDIWDNVSLPWDLNTTRFTGIATRPDGNGLLVVGNQSFSAFVNLSKVMRFDTGFFADFNGVEYNPVTKEPLYFGPSSLAFSMREGAFPNLPPTARVTSPANGSNWTTADRITFDASTSSDADGDALTFSWFSNTSGFFTNGASFGVFLAPGNHTITVFVDDRNGNNVSASVSVSVTEAQYDPVSIIDSPLPTDTPSDDDLITFSGASSYDLNVADVLTFRWTSDRIGAFGNSSIVVAKLPPATHTITLTVSDSTGRSSNATVVLAVHVGNFPPSPTVASPQGAGTYFSNIPIFLDARGTSDPDSPVLTYVWYDESAEIARGQVNNTTLTAGIHNITLVVSDGAKNAQLVVQIFVGGPADLPPRFVTIEPPAGTVLTGTVVFSGTVEVDPVGPVRSVRVKVGDDFFLDASGTTGWTLSIDTTAYPNGPVNVTFRASDANTSHVVEVTRAYTIDNPVVNAPPTVTIATPRSGDAVAPPFEVAGTADDPEGASLTVEYQLAGGAWRNATVTGNTWTFTVASGASPDGPLLVEVRSFDGVNYSQSAFVTVNVDNPDAVCIGCGPDPTLVIIGVLVAVAVAGIAVLLLLRRRK